MTLELSQHIFEKCSNLMKIRPVVAELFSEMNRRTERQTDIKKLIVALRNFATAPKNIYSLKSA